MVNDDETPESRVYRAVVSMLGAGLIEAHSEDCINSQAAGASCSCKPTIGRVVVKHEPLCTSPCSCVGYLAFEPAA